MAWIEQQRTRSGKLFRDDVDPLKHSLDAQSGARWHYSTAYGTGTYDNEVDFTPERITAGGYDGWRVQAAPWHYFLGQYPGNAGDGWVGFGGRRGQHALWFRLLRVGYLRWTNRTWNDLGGAPDYNRANLSQQVLSATVDTTGQSIPVEAVATWSSIWSTPGGGDVSVRWRADGNRLKEEIVLNQAARDYAAANYPGGPTNQQYFGFVFEIDPSDIPRWVKQGILQDIEGDWDDDDGQSGITLENAAQEALAFLPLSDAYVPIPDGVEPDDRQPVRLRKRIYKDGSNYYLLIGARVDLLNAMPAGDLVFDPSVDAQVGAGTGDAYEKDDDTGFSGTAGVVYIIRQTASSTRYNAGFYWPNIAVDQGATINDGTYFQGWQDPDSNQNDHYYDWHGNDVDDANNFSDEADVTGRARTTAFVSQTDENVTIDDWHTSNELKTVIQEIVDRGSWASGNAMALLAIAHTGTIKIGKYFTYESGSAYGAKLHIEYTAGGGADPEGSLVGGKLIRGGLLKHGVLVR